MRAGVDDHHYHARRTTGVVAALRADTGLRLRSARADATRRRSDSVAVAARHQEPDVPGGAADAGRVRRLPRARGARGVAARASCGTRAVQGRRSSTRNARRGGPPRHGGDAAKRAGGRRAAAALGEGRGGGRHVLRRTSRASRAAWRCGAGRRTCARAQGRVYLARRGWVTRRPRRCCYPPPPQCRVARPPTPRCPGRRRAQAAQGAGAARRRARGAFAAWPARGQRVSPRCNGAAASASRRRPAPPWADEPRRGARISKRNCARSAFRRRRRRARGGRKLARAMAHQPCALHRRGAKRIGGGACAVGGAADARAMRPRRAGTCNGLVLMKAATCLERSARPGAVIINAALKVAVLRGQVRHDVSGARRGIYSEMRRGSLLNIDLGRC